MSEHASPMGEQGSESMSHMPNGLREARERAGLHLVALAAMLKVPVQRLDALESGRYRDLPDMTFARALASSVCRVLKIDAQPVLAALPVSPTSRLGEPVGSLSTPMPVAGRTTFGQPSSSSGERKVPWFQALALLLAVVALTLWFLLPERLAETVTSVVDAPVLAVAPVEPVAIAVPVETSALAAVVKEAPVMAATPQESGLAATVGAAATASPLAAEVAPVASPEGVLQLKATQASWVQVTGASGRVLLQRGLQTGELVSFSADLPLSVVIGRADGTEVVVRGAVFDLKAHTRNNVARFEVR